jgi:hypothetical protein
MNNPRLTISIAIDQKRARGEKCLQSLLAQTALTQMEIIIFDFAPTTVPDLPSANHPQVRVIRHAMMGLSDWRYLVMTEFARGEWVAFIEEHCTTNPEWAEGVFFTADAHPQVAIITPEVSVANFDGFWNNYTTRTGLINWLHPMKEGVRTDFFINNCAFLRHMMLELGESFHTLSVLDHKLATYLNEHGYEVYGQPACKIIHENEKNAYDCLQSAIWWRWSFTVFRSQSWQWWVKLVLVAYTPIAPFVRTYRSIRHIQKGGMFPSTFWEMMRLIITIFIFRVVDAIVQLLALFWGIGEADCRFLRLGMNADRL